MQILKKNGLFSDPNSLIGKDVSGVTILDLLGHGASGLVYTAFQRSLKRKIALKVIPKQNGREDEFIQIRDEAETVAVLNHPNIVTVFDVGETEEFLFIKMQLIEGESLKAVINRHLRHPVPSRRLIAVQHALTIMSSVLDALDYAHKEDIVHQDVKPGNILIETTTGRPFLVDFGIARTFVTEDNSKVVRGTPLYIAPEQARGEVTDARADIYSAGVVLWESLAGTLPVAPQSPVKMVGLKARNPESFFLSTPSRHNQRIDLELEQIILQATNPVPEMRYQSASQFCRNISQYQSGGGMV
ncbi:MAG: serine/threonine-protein kinase [Chitinispirillaceae bacterium]